MNDLQTTTIGGLNANSIVSTPNLISSFINGIISADSVALGGGMPDINSKAGLSGIAIGLSASTQNATQAIAIGNKAICTVNNSVQLGEGTNNTANSLQFANCTIAKQVGTEGNTYKIPVASLDMTTNFVSKQYEAVGTNCNITAWSISLDVKKLGLIGKIIKKVKLISEKEGSAYNLQLRLDIYKSGAEQSGLDSTNTVRFGLASETEYEFTFNGMHIIQEIDNDAEYRLVPITTNNKIWLRCTTDLTAKTGVLTNNTDNTTHNIPYIEIIAVDPLKDELQTTKTTADNALSTANELLWQLYDLSSATGYKYLEISSAIEHDFTSDAKVKVVLSGDIITATSSDTDAIFARIGYANDFTKLKYDVAGPFCAIHKNKIVFKNLHSYNINTSLWNTSENVIEIDMKFINNETTIRAITYSISINGNFVYKYTHNDIGENTYSLKYIEAVDTGNPVIKLYVFSNYYTKSEIDKIIKTIMDLLT